MTYDDIIKLNFFSIWGKTKPPSSNEATCHSNTRSVGLCKFSINFYSTYWSNARYLMYIKTSWISDIKSNVCFDLNYLKALSTIK